MTAAQDTGFDSKRTINCRGSLIDLSHPRVMAILNVTPDSFYDGGANLEIETLLANAEKHLSEGATFLDIGAVSTRPGADPVSEADELKRLLPAIEAIRIEFPEALISVDTFRSRVARDAIAAGACMVNDVSGGQLDDDMFSTIGALQVPYVLMHMKGTPQTMQQNPVYEDIFTEVNAYFTDSVAALRQAKVLDIILDLGFGFGKTIEHNFALLNKMQSFSVQGLPILTGISRKSMINKTLGTKAAEALNGTTVLNTIALINGSSVLRVHDVEPAMQAIKLVEALGSHS